MKKWIRLNIVVYVLMFLSTLFGEGLYSENVVGAVVVGLALMGTSVSLQTGSKFFWVVGQAGNVFLFSLIVGILIVDFSIMPYSLSLVFVLLGMLTVNNFRLLMKTRFIWTDEHKKVVDVDYEQV